MEKNRKRGKRFLALLLSAVLFATQTGTIVYAEGAAGGLCEHHSEHIGCSYREAVPGQPCRHSQHAPDCYTDELICGYEEGEIRAATESDALLPHKHAQECHKLYCPHEHGVHDLISGEDCGYVEAVEGRDCDYHCTVCAGNPSKDDDKDKENKKDEGVKEDESGGETDAFIITGFDKLDRAVRHQEVPIKSPQSDVDLPGELAARGHIVEGAKEGEKSSGGGVYVGK